MTEKKDETKKENNATPVFTTQKFKWEQKQFLDALEDGRYEDAMAIMEFCVESLPAKRKWWDREEAKPHYYKYIQWLRSCRQQAGNKDWRMWDKVLEENRFMMEVPRMDQKIDVTSRGEKLEAVSIVDLGNLHADKPEAK